MAKLPSINIKISKDFFGKLFKNLGWAFFALFVILVVLEIIEIKNSVSFILNLNQQPEVNIHSKGDRINFDDYDAIVKRIQAAPNFTSDNSPINDPFNPSASPPPAAPAATSTPVSTTTPAGK
jgi:hypothetical protein